MLIIIALILLLGVGFLMMWHSGRTRSDAESLSGVLIVGLAGFALCTLVVVAIVQNVRGPHEAADLEQWRLSLYYQLENDLYDNDNDLGKKELYDQITQYNSRVATGKAMQHDLWVGALFPDIYDAFELIPLE